MKHPTKRLWFGLPLSIAVVAGAAGDIWTKTAVEELITHPMGAVAELETRDVVWAFGSAKHALEMLSREQDEEPVGRARFFRTARRIVLAESPNERERLLDQALEHCRRGWKDGCTLDGVHRFVGIAARSRLVPPGNEIECECSKKREPLPALE